MDEARWIRVTAIFDQLLEGADLDTALAEDSDAEVRAAALNLWRHHERADQQGYLDRPMEFAVAPVFESGQVLLNRFRIERLLGRGGMGEVYLAWDQRVEEWFAIKTIARLLAPSQSIRRRFIGEVQHARRVTHCNVCRIHEVFDEGETVFFSMEYVEGALLSDLLDPPPEPRIARDLLRQLAEGLRAAHRIGVVHGDFKPANVMVAEGGQGTRRAVIMDFGLALAIDRNPAAIESGLSVRAGTADYMAPELKEGRPPTIRSDIFAFGVVGRTLFPKERIWDECTDPEPANRPDTLDRIGRHLESDGTRRYWLAAAAATVGAAGYEIWRPFHARTYIPEGARILVNGFQAVAGQIPGARLARSLFLTALEQSSLIHVIAEQDLLQALLRHQPSGRLPLTGRTLADLLVLLHAAFWIEGELERVGARYSLYLRLQDANNHSVVASARFRDVPNVLALAQAAAQWLRSAAGESARSLAINPVSVGSYTSEIPEALQKYYDGMERYARAEMNLATPLFQEAVRLDPGFAQAHNMLARTLNSDGLYDEGFRENEIAMRQAQRLPERERTTIESNYYRMVQDEPRMIAASRQNLVYHPDEPRSYAMLAERLADTGNLAEAIIRFRQAMNLASDDWMIILQLEWTLTANGQFTDALREFEAARSRGVADPWLFNGAGYAYMGLERYDDALRMFAQEPQDDLDLAGDGPGADLLRGRLDSAVAAMEQRRASVDNPIHIHHVNDFLCGLYFATGQTKSALASVQQMADLSPYPPNVRYLGCTASWSRRLGDDETIGKVRSLADEIARRWPDNNHTASLQAHVDGLQAWRRNDTKTARERLQWSVGAAYGVWNLFDLAEFFTATGEWDLAEDSWKKFDLRRGTVLYQRWFPGLLVLGWLYRAAAAQSRRDNATALTYSQKVLDHWSGGNARLQIVQTARIINATSKTV